MPTTSLVARLSQAFVKNYRLTLLLFAAILGLGFLSYTRFLKIEGFPAVGVPVVIVEASYFVNDAAAVDRDVTTPVEDAAAELAEVQQVQSTTTPFGAVAVVQFADGTEPEDGARLLQESVERSVQLPDGAALTYRTINAGAIDGEHELIFNVSGQASIERLQAAADVLARDVAAHSDVARAETLALLTERTNPLTGQAITEQTAFNRVGYRGADDVLTFEPAVAVGVVRKPGVGTVELSKFVRDAVDAALADTTRDDVLGDVTVTYGGDFSGDVLQQRSSLEQNALYGLISVIVLILLLIDWRASIVGGIFIPLVFAGVFLALYLIGYTLNVISLFALVLVLGMFVDNATVVIDAIERKKDEGHRGLAAIGHAIGEVGTSIIAGTWTTILVFVPMAFISGVLGEFILLIPVTVITALLISIVLTLTVVPWLGNLFIRDKHAPQKPRTRAGRIAAAVGRIVRWPNVLVARLARAVSALIFGYLGRRWKVAAVIVATLVLIAVGGSYAQRLTFSVFPPASDADQIVLSFAYPAGTNVPAAESTAREAEAALEHALGNDLVALTCFGANETSATAFADISPVGDREATASELVAALQPALDEISGARITAKVATVGPPEQDYQLTVRVLADTTTLLERGTADVAAFLEDRDLGASEHVIEVSVERFDVLSKIDGRRFAEVRARTSDPVQTNLTLDLQAAVEEHYTAERLQDLGLADDAVSIDLGQEGENVDSFASAALALLIALIVMYGLLVWQFNSFVQPLLIFLAIPFSFPVLFPALFATGNDLSFFVMLGMIALAGVVVNNTIMLLHQANLLRQTGATAREAISAAVRIRFRALLATSLTTIAGLVPLALSDPFWEPLAFTIIFGLASSVVLAIVAFPSFYVVAESVRAWSSRLRTRLQPR